MGQLFEKPTNKYLSIFLLMVPERLGIHFDRRVKEFKEKQKDRKQRER